MSEISQERAFSVLREAKEKRILKPSIEARLAQLVRVETRPKAKKALKTSVAAKDIEGSEQSEIEKPRKLTPEQQAEFLSALEDRFNRKSGHYKRPEGVNFAEVKKLLETNPAVMYSLAQMENTRGAPDIIAVKKDAFIFGDCSAESPNRRNLTYDQAAEMAKEFGVDMMPKDTYRAMQKRGKFDRNSWSWLATPMKIRKSGDAVIGLRDNIYHNLRIYRDNPYHSNLSGGWRGMLKVPRV